MAKVKTNVVLDIGTTKTRMVVGSVTPSGRFDIRGLGETRTCGMKNGEIINRNQVRQSICEAWQNAQLNSDTEIVSVFLAISGERFYSETTEGTFRLPEEENIVTEEHMREARLRARLRDRPPSHKVIHTISNGYSLDHAEPSYGVLGLSANTLDVKMHTVTADSNFLTNVSLCVLDVPLLLEERDIAFAPIATAEHVIDVHQKKSGALVIDIGGGKTDYICYCSGEIIASGCIPVGGNNIDEDIAYLAQKHEGQSNISAKDACYAKESEGNAMGDVNDRSLIVMPRDLGFAPPTISRGLLHMAIRDRLVELLSLIKRNIPEHVWERPDMQVYLVGGTSFTRGLDALAEKIFPVPVRQQTMPTVENDTSYMHDPRYCTCLGMLYYACALDEQRYYSKRSWFSRFISFAFGIEI